MKKCRLLLLLLVLCPSLLVAGEIKVEIIGGNHQDKLELGIARTVYARSLAKGVNVAASPDLVVTLTQMGSALSLDAFLESTPPRAFHRDLNSIDQLSGAIDELLTSVYLQPAVLAPLAQPLIPAQPAVQPQQAADLPKAIKLPFRATSLSILNDTVYVANTDQIYCLVDNKPVPYWKAPQTEEIFRIYSYQDSLIVVSGRSERLASYRIKDKTVISRWDAAVVPFGNGLIAGSLNFKADFVNLSASWGLPILLEGQPEKIDLPLDVLSLAAGDILPEAPGTELASLDQAGKLEIYNAKTKVWASGDKTGHQALFIGTSPEISNNPYSDKRPVRYYLKSRLLTLNDGSLLCIHSTDGFTSLTQYFARFAANAIIQYKPENGEMELNEVVNLGTSYCADIAVKDDQLLYLAVNKKRSQLKFEKLP